MAKRISIGSWAYSIGPYAKNPVPFDDVVSKLAELGFDGVELGGFSPHPNPDDFADAASRAALKKRVADAGLAFSGLAANLWMHKIISVADNSPFLAEFDKNVQFSNDLGIDLIRVDTLEPPTIFEKVEYNLAFDRVVAAFKEAARRAADAGMTICWDFEPGFAFNKPSDVVKIIDAVGAPNFGALYDTCHANMVAKIGSRQPGEKETLPGGALELLHLLKGKITHVHLIDSDDLCHKDANGDDETSAHPPFGEGHLNFDELMPAIMDCGVKDDWWAVDLCFWANAWEATAKCKKFLDEQRVKYGQVPA
ncbi:MAG: sugar phosphate isomerase/epimerase family protein [Planctomycetia bacterium]